MSIDTSNQFPDFGHQPPVDPDQTQPAPSESVVHSGNVPTDEGGERPDRELPGTLLDDVHEGRIVPPTTNDSRRNWFARHPKISGLSAVTVLGLVGFGAYELGTQNDDSHATPPLGSETAVSSAPFSSANLSTPPSPIDKGTAKVSIVAPPVPTNETAPSTQANQVTSEPTSPSTTNEAPASFVLEPAPNASEYPAELQKYVVNQEQAAADPGHYWPAYAKAIGMKVTFIDSADKNQIETYLTSPDTAAVYSVPFAKALEKYQGSNLDAYANAVVNNPNLDATTRQAMGNALMPFFTLDAEDYQKKPEDYYFLNSLDNTLAKLPHGSEVTVQLVACDVAYGGYPDNCAVDVSVNGQLAKLPESDTYFKFGDIRLSDSTSSTTPGQLLIR